MAQSGAQSGSDEICGPAGCGSRGSATSLRDSTPVVIRDMPDRTVRPSSQNAPSYQPGITRPNGSAGTLGPAATPPVPTDFEQFVEQALGHRLTVFGSDLFLKPSGNFVAPQDGLSPPKDHIVGPGDEIIVRAWGKVDIDAHPIVNQNGQIFLPRIGTLTVAGLRLEQLSGFLQDAIGRQFKGFELTVTLGQLRSIQIFVLGHALRPGAYTVSSLSTMVNALFVTGGPSPSGSLRDIQLKRGGQVIARLDLYKLLIDGDKSQDATLMAGDVLYIPLVGPQVAIDGDVMTPGIFELKRSSKLDDLLEVAGGLTPVASTDRILVDRVTDHAHRTMKDFPLDSNGRETAMQAGDIVRVLPVSSQIEDAITLQGPVSVPGRYAWHSGMRISDVIRNRQTLISRSYYNRKNASTIDDQQNPFAPAREKDKALTTVRTPNRQNGLERAEDDQDSSESSVSNPSSSSSRKVSSDELPSSDKSRNRDTETSTHSSKEVAGVLSLPKEEDTSLPTERHDTEIDWNYAVIERLDPKDLTTRLVPFVLGDAVDHPESAENKILEPGDVITVYARRDLRLPAELAARFVRIEGEVKAPGVYRVRPEETLRDLVVRAGGLAPHAYVYATALTRESVRIAQEEQFRALLQEVSRGALSPANIQGASRTSPGTSPTELEIRKAYIVQLSQFHPTGRVKLNINPHSSAIEDVPEFALEDGDRIYIPSRLNTVDVIGSVYNQGAMKYVEDARIRTYFNAAGGATREGDYKREFVVRANGMVESRQNGRGFLNAPVYPGDTLIVPPQLVPNHSRIDWSQVMQWMSTIALTAVTIRAVQ